MDTIEHIERAMAKLGSLEDGNVVDVVSNGSEVWSACWPAERCGPTDQAVFVMMPRMGIDVGLCEVSF